MKKKRVLLVDDEDNIRKSLGWVLNKNNFEVTTSPSGEEAVELLRRTKYDLVITDLVMGNLDGLEVLKLSKKYHPETGVIILTGHAGVSSAVKALNLGADDYIQKPCDTDDLLNKVNRSIEKKDLLARLREQNEKLKEEIAARRTIEAELQKSRANLELEVANRTRELTNTVDKLTTVLGTLQIREKELEKKNKELHDINTTLSIMLKRREQEHIDIRKEIAAEAIFTVNPLLKKARSRAVGPAKDYIETAEANLREVFVKHPQDVLRNAKLAPRELQIVHYIRQNKTSKEIADLLDLSVRTVESYRENIRDKLGLKNQKKNLKKFLTSIL